jgi:hypothetical protein
VRGARSARLAPVTLLLLAGVAGCTSGAIPPVSSAEVPGIGGRECRYTVHPDSLAGPGFAESEQGRALRKAAGMLGDEEVHLSVRYDDGELDWVRPIGVAPGFDRPAELARRVAELLPAEGSPAWSVRIRATGGAPEILPGIRCEAEVAGSRAPMPPDLGRIHVSRVTGGEASYTIRVRVDEAGRPTDPRVIRRSAAFSGMESALIEMALTREYRPALHDGIPVPATVDYESGIRIRRQ